MHSSCVVCIAVKKKKTLKNITEWHETRNHFITLTDFCMIGIWIGTSGRGLSLMMCRVPNEKTLTAVGHLSEWVSFHSPV